MRQDRGPDLAEAQWLPAPRDLRCGQGEVHVWRVDLDVDQVELGHLEALLAPDELARAGRFRRALDVRHFVAARGRLRQVLARYIGADPGAVAIATGRFGKPELGPPSSSRGLNFNLSHAGGRALVAIAQGRAVGVDLEPVRSDVDVAGIAERFFAHEERAELAELPPELRTVGFYTIWTAKEAFVKALGAGLQMEFASFAVSLGHRVEQSAPGVTSSSPAGERLTLARLADPDVAAAWTLVGLAVYPGFCAAVAVEGAITCLRLWEPDA